jgi:serine/threonine-protein kinase
MNLDRWRRIRELSEAAAERPEAERAAWLESVEPDAELRARALALLADRTDETKATATTQPSRLSPEAIAAAVDATVGGTAWAGRRIGAWRLVEAIGRGGMGEVWRAERIDGGFRQHAAIKLMRRGIGDADYLGRFEAERQILARLEHPNIARLLDGGALEDGQPWLALEFVRGSDLVRHADARRLDVRERIGLFLGVCAAVAHAHRMLVVHRDLKPSNVMVTDDGTVKLLDFGIAKLLPGAEEHFGTETAAAPLTPAYAAPEQLRREPIGTPTDVYALGLLLHELLTGVLPHRRRGSQSAEALVEILTREPPPASVALERHVDDDAERTRLARERGADVGSLRRALRGDLDAIIARALRPRPEDRYASVDALAADLENHLARRPVSARRGSFRYRAGRFVARHRAAVALAGLLAVSLVAGVAAIVVQSSEVARERDRAVLEGQRANSALAFQREIFRRARPATHLGREPTASELLDLGERMLAEDTGLDPGVRATLLEELSHSRGSLGAFDRAHALALEARESFAAHGDRRGALRLDIHLASLEVRLGQPAEARARIDQVLGAAPDDLLPPEEIYAAWFQRGILLGNAGELDGAVRAIGTAIELAGRTDVARPVRPTAVVGMEVVLAGYLSGAGRAEEALARIGAARERLLSLGQFDDAARQQLLHAEGFALELLDRLDEARAAIEARLDLSTRIYGPKHHMVAQDLAQLARLALKQHDPALALRHAEAALPILLEQFGPDNAETAFLRHTLALARLRSGDPAGARADAGAALEARRRIHGENDTGVLNARAVLAMIDEATGAIDAARRGAIGIREAAGERWDRISAPTRARLDAIRIYHGPDPASERCRALESHRRQATDPTGTLVLGLYLAACRQLAGEPDAARELLDGLDAERVHRIVGDPALARVRAIAEGRGGG